MTIHVGHHFCFSMLFGLVGRGGVEARPLAAFRAPRVDPAVIRLTADHGRRAYGEMRLCFRFCRRGVFWFVCFCLFGFAGVSFSGFIVFLCYFVRG